MCSSFGDDFRTKRAKTIRIAYFNPNGMGSKGDSLKMECMYSFLRRHEVDVFGLSETNVDWRIVKYQDSMWGRINNWFENRKMSVSYNLRESSSESTYQVGGTSTLVFDKLATCRTKIEVDSTRLGRWSSILMYGKGEVKTRLITVYCPCKNKKKGKSVYQQHLRYFRTKNMQDVCPVQQFWADLKSVLRTWIDAGEQIIIGGDWNHNIRKVTKKLKDLGLREIITTAHGIDQAPPTHNRGSYPIDGIFGNSTISATRCGYLPFNKCISSDHRILWMDVPMDAFLGFSLHATTVPAARRLKMNDPRIKKKYNQYLHDFSLKHKLYDLILSIYKRTVYPMPADVIADLQKFERLRSEGMAAAEKRCRHLHRGVFPWSPTFSKARDMIKMWTMVKLRKQTFEVDLKSILRVSRRINERVDFSLTLVEVQTRIDASWKEYFSVKKHAKDLRNTFIKDLAIAKAEEDNTSVASKLRQLLNREELRQLSKAVKFTLGKLYSSGLTRVLVPDDQGNLHEDGERYREVTDKAELERTLLRDNPGKYHKCESYCELLSGQLLEDIGYSGEGPRVKDILDGTYECPPGTSSGTRLFLEHMKRHPDCDKLKTISARSSVEEYRRCWKRAKERSSSNGILHNAHYKVGCEHKHIRHMHYALAEVLFRSGHYLDRHRHGVDCMLVKKADDYRLQKLRTIFLFDAELNMNMGRVGEAGLASYIAGGDMADEQYSRPCRSSIDHVVNRQLTFDYYFFVKSPFGMCSCDLAGNYDRIVHSAASLALQRVGIPLSRIHGLFDTIQRMIKKVRTAYGDSEGTYGGDHVEWPFKNLPMGMYQGNRMGPPIWSIISSTIFYILRRKGFSVKFIHALSREVYELAGFAYVDDADITMNGESVFKVAEDMQKALNLYRDVMNATGQALAPEKSWWYLVDLVWTRGKWVYQNGDVRSDLVATDSNGKRVSLKRLVFSEAQKMLGVYLAPNGDKKAELVYLKEKACKWADMIRTGHLGPSETWIALSTGIWKTLLYPMAATMFTESEIRSFTSPIMNIALPRMLINRNIALPLRYGPSRLGGLGLPSPFLDQGIKKIQYIVEHIWKQTPTGKILQRNLSYLCLEGGFYGNPFVRDTRPLVWMTSVKTWIAFAWTFMEDHNIQIHHLQCEYLTPIRTHDVPIMLGFARTDASPAILKKLNACRLFLRVVSLSEICLADGKSIDSRFLYKDSPIPSPRLCNSYHWPVQPRPSYAYWRLWDEYVKKAFCSEQSSLTSELGPFHVHDVANDPRWDWFAISTHSSVFDSLWHFDHDVGVWQEYLPVSKCSVRRRRFRLMSTVERLPPLQQVMTPITVSERSLNEVTILSRSDPIRRYETEVGNTPSTPVAFASIRVTGDDFRKALRQCSDSAWYIQHLIVPDDVTSIFRDFLEGKLLTGSDGSFHPHAKFGTACWRLESWDAAIRIFGYCIIPGRRSINSSFRCELGGILGNSLCLWALAQIALKMGYTKDTLWKVLVSCDGYAALERSLLSNPDRLSTTYKHFDLASAIIGIWRDMPCSSFPVYVKSHMDEVLPPSELSPLQQINISVDICAKEYMKRCVERGTSIPSGHFQFGLPVVTFDGAEVATELYSSLLHFCTESGLRRYWLSNWQIQPEYLTGITWDGFERGMSMLSKQKRVFITKWLCRQISVGPISQRYDAAASGKCLRCHQASETLIHCVRCPAIRPKVNDRLTHLYEQMTEYGTSPELVAGIRLCTLHWLQESDTHPLMFMSHLECDETVNTLCDLYAFGWWRFLQGIHLKSFRILQQQFFDDTHPSKSLSFWHGRITRALWDFLCDLHEDRRQFLVQRRMDLEPINPAARAARRVAVRELSLGTATVRPFYHHLFHINKKELRQMNVSTLRSWLRNVRYARENDTSHQQTVDEFTPNGKFRAWLLRK